MSPSRSRGTATLSTRWERPYRTRYHAQWVLPISSPPVEDGTVVVEHDRIVYAGPRRDAPSGRDTGRDTELGAAIIAPGFVNAHTHLDLTVTRGHVAAPSFFDWIRAVVAIRDRMTPAELLDSARAGIIEGLRAGVTTYADTGPSVAAFDAMRELGVRGIAYHEVFGPDPATCAVALRDLGRALAEMQTRETPLVRAGVSPHAPYSVSDVLYRKVAALARERGLPLATHIAEGEDEAVLVSEGTGAFAGFLGGRGIAVAPRARTPVSLLDDCGVLGPNALLIHCVRVDAADIQAIAGHGCGVATCPVSNTRLSHGAAPVRDLLDAGCRVGVGSDSMASNDGMDIWYESGLATGARDDEPPHDRGQHARWELATLGGARALRMESEIGSLEVGKQADFAAFPMSARASRASMDTGASGARPPVMSASLVVVAGREVIRNGQVI
jgi:cytosine/adenosine deaminase-related metal-dependent hydrolase